MFGTFPGQVPHMSGGVAFDPYGPEQPTYGPSVGDSALGHYIGAKGYDGGIHNSPFAEGRMKDPFSAPGQFNPFMFMRPRRRRLNFLSMVQITMLLFGIFALVSYLFGFSARLTAPMWCWFFFSFCLFLSFVCLVKAAIVWRKQRQEQWSTPWYLMNDDDTWFLFLGVAIAISCFLGLAVGEIIFGGYSQPYYTLSELHSYKDVDPTDKVRPTWMLAPLLLRRTAWSIAHVQSATRMAVHIVWHRSSLAQTTLQATASLRLVRIAAVASQVILTATRTATTGGRMGASAWWTMQAFRSSSWP